MGNILGLIDNSTGQAVPNADLRYPTKSPTVAVPNILQSAAYNVPSMVLKAASSVPASQAAVFTAGNTNIITGAGTALEVDAPVQFTTTGVLPTTTGDYALKTSETYYIRAVSSTSPFVFSISHTPGGTALSFSSAGSGTHTMTAVVRMQEWRDSSNNIIGRVDSKASMRLGQGNVQTGQLTLEDSAAYSTSSMIRVVLGGIFTGQGLEVFSVTGAGTTYTRNLTIDYLGAMTASQWIFEGGWGGIYRANGAAGVLGTRGGNLFSNTYGLQITTSATYPVAITSGTDPTCLYMYNTYKDASNYERAHFCWQMTPNTLTIGTTVANSSTVTAGRNIVIQAAHAVAPVSGSASGGSISILGGNALRNTTGAGSGGGVTIRGGTPDTTSGSAAGGDITIEGGSGFNTSSGRTDQSGIVYIKGGSDSTAGSLSGSVQISSGTNIGATPYGILLYTPSQAYNTQSIKISTGDASGNQATSGSIELLAGAANYVSASSGTQTGGSITLTTQSGRGQLSGQGLLVAGAGGPITLTLGVGGVASGTDASGNTGGAGGTLSLVGGTGGAATGSGQIHTGGAGSSFVFTAGTGGNATGSSGTRTGGAGGSIILTAGAGGTGSTANGAAGSISLRGGGANEYANSFNVTSSGVYMMDGSGNTVPLLGFHARSVGYRSLAIGFQVNSYGATNVNSAMAIGDLASVYAGATSSMAIGMVAATRAPYAIALGAYTDAKHAYSIVIGNGMGFSTDTLSSTAANQLVIGGYGAAAINDAYLGGGVTSTSPTGITINATGGSGTDIAGATLTLAGGKGTGAGTPGSILLKTATAGTTGTTQQTLTTRVTVDNTGATVDGDVAVGGDDYFYLGDRNTNGSWRIGKSGADLVFQVRLADVWTTKSQVLAS